MKVLKVNGNNNDFLKLCEELENFQFNLMPELKENGYSLTDDLDEVIGYILYINEEPIASIGLKGISNDSAEIVRVFVKEKYRRNGYAKLLFNKIEELAKSLSYKRLEMIAWTKASSALQLYKYLGFTISKPKNSEWFSGLQYVELFKELY